MKKLRIEFVVTYEHDIMRREVADVKRIVNAILDDYSFSLDTNWSKRCVSKVSIDARRRAGKGEKK